MQKTTHRYVFFYEPTILKLNLLIIVNIEIPIIVTRITNIQFKYKNNV